MYAYNHKLITMSINNKNTFSRLNIDSFVYFGATALGQSTFKPWPSFH